MNQTSRLARVVIALFVALVLWIILALLPTVEARGPRGLWLPVFTPRGADQARVTYYGPKYDDGQHYCMNGQLYTGNAQIVALGPTMLRQARALSGERWPLVRLQFEGGQLYYCRVGDSGGSYQGVELEVDLPDNIWLLVTGLEPDAGVAYATVQVFSPERTRP